MTTRKTVRLRLTLQHKRSVYHIRPMPNQLIFVFNRTHQLRQVLRLPISRVWLAKQCRLGLQMPIWQHLVTHTRLDMVTTWTTQFGIQRCHKPWQPTARLITRITQVQPMLRPNVLLSCMHQWAKQPQLWWMPIHQLVLDQRPCQLMVQRAQLSHLQLIRHTQHWTHN